MLKLNAHGFEQINNDEYAYIDKKGTLGSFDKPFYKIGKSKGVYGAAGEPYSRWDNLKTMLKMKKPAQIEESYPRLITITSDELDFYFVHGIEKNLINHGISTIIFSMRPNDRSHMKSCETWILDFYSKFFSPVGGTRTFDLKNWLERLK